RRRPRVAALADRRGPEGAGAKQGGGGQPQRAADGRLYRGRDRHRFALAHQRAEQISQRRRRMTEHIKIESKDHVLTLTFTRPDKKNALTNLMYGTLADAIIAAETDKAVRVIVLRGEGDMFTAGNDVAEFAMMATGAFKGERHVSRFVEAIARSTQPL